MDNQKSNYNIENTAELLTGSGKSGRSMRIALIVAGAVALLAILLAVFFIAVRPDTGTSQTDETYSEEMAEDETEDVSEEEELPQGDYSKTGMLTGIIIESQDRLFAIDPDSGVVTAVRDFTPKDPDVVLVGNVGNNAFQKLQLYNKDLTKRLARKKSGVPGHDGIYEHIGWVNTDGEFEDITALMESFENEDSFSGSPEPLSMYRARNYIDKYIYAEAAEELKTYRIPMDDMSPSTLETYGEYSDIGYFDGEASFADPSGIMGERRIDGFSSDGYYRKNDSGEHEYTWAEGQTDPGAENDSYFKDGITLRWISEDSYILTQSRGADMGPLYLCQRKGGNEFICRAIIPYVEGRTYLTYAVSPDNNRVAVISRKADLTNLYIADTNAPGEPQKLEINEDLLYDLELDETTDLMKGIILCWSDGSEHPQEAEIREYLNTPECKYQAKVSSDYYGGLQ